MATLRIWAAHLALRKYITGRVHDETLFKSSLRPNTGLASHQFKPGLHNKGLPILENKYDSFKVYPTPWLLSWVQMPII